MQLQGQTFFITASSALDLAVQAFGGLKGVINRAGIGLAQRTLARDEPHPLASFVRVITLGPHYRHAGGKWRSVPRRWRGKGSCQNLGAGTYWNQRPIEGLRGSDPLSTTPRSIR